MKLKTQHITPIKLSVDNKDKIVSSTHNIEYELTPNRSKWRKNKPKFIVIHYTAAPSSERCFASMLNPKFKRSAHYLVPRDDEKNTPDFYCLGAHDMILWHAGKSRYEHNGKIYKGFNSISIGIEIQNFGKLTKQNDGTYETWFGKKVSSSEIYKDSNNTAWHSYTPKQIDYVYEICKTLIKHYPTIKEIVGHDDIAGFRGKIDPGKNFPMSQLKNWAKTNT